MTTITNKKQYPSEQYLNELITNMEFAAMAPVEVVRVMAAELQERRKADNQEPAGYHVIRECGKVGCSVATLEEAEKTRDFWNKKWTIRPYFYTAQPAQETGVYKDMLNIIGLLENNEWAEHCTSTVLGSLLESEITRLVGKEQPVPVVPDDISGIIERFQYQADHLSEWHHIDEHSCKVNRRDLMTALEFMDSCRTAMLQGVEPVSNHDELALYYLQGQKDGLEWAAQLAEANHPLTGDWLYDDPLELAKAIRKGPDMPEFAGSSPVTQDGWISCSERMPAQDDWVLIYSKYGEYLAGQVQGEYVELNDGTLSWLGAALHWMPLPEPPQEVK